MTASYDLRAIRAPRLTGRALQTFVRLLETGPTRALIAGRMLRDAGIERFRRERVDEAPAVRPPLPAPGALSAALPEPPPPDLGQVLAGTPEPRPGYRFERVADFAHAYREGRATPEQVAERVLEAIAASDRGPTPLRAFIATDPDDLRAQARASAERHREGRPLGPLDGVPVAVKDELDQVPFPTTVGTRFLGGGRAREDATVVARLRAAGALLIGKANMHEIGIGVTGLNPHHGCARNPYHLGHHTGGSSSGPGAAVAAGLCPLAVGADGGGSIRTPASLCGVVGLKATLGRVSEHGAFPLCWSVGHVGPLAATARDAALGYAVMAGPDPRDPYSLLQPPPHLEGLDGGDLAGVRVGVYRPWFEDADPEVVRACEHGLDLLRDLGAEVREVTLPGLEAARVAHLITIASEMAHAMEPYEEAHGEALGLDVRVNLALARLLTSRDYVRAQRVRTRFTVQWLEALRDADLIVTPTAGRTAPPIAPAALERGESDITTTGEILRFVFAANLNGLPALTAPIGYDGRGLPIGLPALGRPWEEALLLRVAEALERRVERRAPALSYRLLEG